MSSRFSDAMKQIFADLQSPEPDHRAKAWNTVLADLLAGNVVANSHECNRLFTLLTKEEDLNIWKSGMNAFAGTLLRKVLKMNAHGNTDAIGAGLPFESLAEWLWDCLLGPSVVVSFRDRRMMLRDEDALFALRGLLSRREYPRTNFLRYQGRSIQFEEMLHEKDFDAICFVGRLGLFGRKAVKQWRLKNPRFHFRLQRRPPHLKPGELDRDFHCIFERDARGIETDYCTRDNKGIRSDYGVVQRYVVSAETKHVTVLICAGASSLGTLAAVQWAAERLCEPINGKGDLLPACPGIHHNSRLEALIYTYAKATHPDDRWRPAAVHLKQLHVDDRAWNKENQTWQTKCPKTIALQLKDGDRDRPVAVLLDGERLRMRVQSQAFRLLARVLESAYDRPGGVIDLEALAADPWLWPSPLELGELKDKLAQLKNRYLHDTLSMEPGAIKIQAKIEIETE